MLKVVEAIAHQLATLNTNVRYLHSSIIEFAEQLGSTLPPELQVLLLLSALRWLQCQSIAFAGMVAVELCRQVELFLPGSQHHEPGIGFCSSTAIYFPDHSILSACFYKVLTGVSDASNLHRCATT